MSSIKKNRTAECVRQVSNWSSAQPYHRFDSSLFDAKKTLADLPERSPKLKALLDTMEALDARDKQQFGKRFKHFVFTDVVSGAHGSKIVASVFAASSYDVVASDSKALAANARNAERCGLLSSTPIGGKKQTLKSVRAIIATFNRRPDNVHGERMRVLVADSGFKEGIDLFDVKYVHLLEPLLYDSERNQAIGRATRFCGQRDLPFVKGLGWKLHVYTYDTSMPRELVEDSETTTLGDLYVKMSNLDKRVTALTKCITTAVREDAVDHDLNLPVHDPKVRKAPIEVGSQIVCTRKCGKTRPTRFVPVPTPLLFIAWLSLDRTLPAPEAGGTARGALCKLLKHDLDFCARVRECWADPPAFFRKHEDLLMQAVHEKRHKAVPGPQRRRIMEYLLRFCQPPRRRMTSKAMRRHVLKYFSCFAWPMVEFQNGCMEQARDGRVGKLTPTQQFLRYYFTPDSGTKGMLLWHSVGSGKTCAAIAATTAFARAGYTILWATRHTLRRDLLKNLHDPVCNTELKPNGDVGPAWRYPIMSYRQLTNAVSGKNMVHDRLVSDNGAKDPIRKTLIVIDESHRLFNTFDMIRNERPQVDALRKALQRSFEVSGASSARVLLLTATPMIRDPMDILRLVNLCLPTSVQYPISTEEFAMKYFDETGRAFSATGRKAFADAISGVVSYLDRSKDGRQFAQPHEEPDVVAPLSDTDPELLQKLRDAEDRVDDAIAQKEATRVLMDATKAALPRGSKTYGVAKFVGKMLENGHVIREQKRIVSRIKEELEHDASQKAVLARRCKVVATD
jgi:hypothetical protein